MQTTEPFRMYEIIFCPFIRIQPAFWFYGSFCSVSNYLLIMLLTCNECIEFSYKPGFKPHFCISFSTKNPARIFRRKNIFEVLFNRDSINSLLSIQIHLRYVWMMVCRQTRFFLSFFYVKFLLC